jgi:hypothetical protein
MGAGRAWRIDIFSHIYDFNRRCKRANGAFADRLNPENPRIEK